MRLALNSMGSCEYSSRNRRGKRTVFEGEETMPT